MRRKEIECVPFPLFDARTIPGMNGSLMTETICVVGGGESVGGSWVVGRASTVVACLGDGAGSSVEGGVAVACGGAASGTPVSISSGGASSSGTVVVVSGVVGGSGGGGTEAGAAVVGGESGAAMRTFLNLLCKLFKRSSSSLSSDSSSSSLSSLSLSLSLSSSSSLSLLSSGGAVDAPAGRNQLSCLSCLYPNPL